MTTANTKHTITVIRGTFALVASGNASDAWMIDGDDIQDRANEALDWYWRVEGVDATIYERGVEGWGVAIDDQPYMIGLFTTEAAALRARDIAIANLS